MRLIPIFEISIHQSKKVESSLMVVEFKECSIRKFKLCFTRISGPLCASNFSTCRGLFKTLLHIYSWSFVPWGNIQINKLPPIPSCSLKKGENLYLCPLRGRGECNLPFPFHAGCLSLSLIPHRCHLNNLPSSLTHRKTLTYIYFVDGPDALQRILLTSC